MVVEQRKGQITRTRLLPCVSELYGQPEEKQTEWGRHPQQMQRMKAAREAQKAGRQATPANAARPQFGPPATAVNRKFTPPAVPQIHAPEVKPAQPSPVAAAAVNDATTVRAPGTYEPQAVVGKRPRCQCDKGCTFPARFIRLEGGDSNATPQP